MPDLIFPDGISVKNARRLGEIGDALAAGGIEVEAFVDAKLYDLDPPRCFDCGCLLEAGACYCCRPLWGYGERFAAERHGAE